MGIVVHQVPFPSYSREKRLQALSSLGFRSEEAGRRGVKGVDGYPTGRYSLGTLDLMIRIK